MAWSATQYSLFEDERTRAVRDLLAAVPPRPVRHATDLGCGPGNSTEVLLQRYPDAQVTALDSDPDMIDKARERKRLCIPRVRMVIVDIAGWSAPEPQDLILANASLQWVPDHASLYPHLVRQLSEGASLAVQTPDNLDEPAHRQLREIASQGPWAAKFADFQLPPRHSAAFYYDLSGAVGCPGAGGFPADVPAGDAARLPAGHRWQGAVAVPAAVPDRYPLGRCQRQAT